MVQTSTCPGEWQWQQLAVGLLPEEDAEILSQHLEVCPPCVESLRTMQSRDALLDAMRSHGSTPPRPLPGALRGLMQELKQLVNAQDTVTGQGQAIHAPRQDTEGGEGRPVDESSPHPYDFLAPAQQDGELGRLGPYRVLRKLGAGGMGMVFLAEDPRLQRRVALKVMLPRAAAVPHASERFLREARAIAALKHDNIVTIHQVEEASGVPYLAMELLEGESLVERLQRERRLPLQEVLHIGREIAEGLQAAHERGLIHRDIKPANLWLEARSPLPPSPPPPQGEGGARTPAPPSPLRGGGLGGRGRGGRVKILDFGLARAPGEDSLLTQQGAILGTPAYMAPEQAESGPVDHRCDLFSLGCVLYQMCTGEIPFQGKNAIKTLMAVSNKTPRAPRELNTDLPEDFSNLVMRLLSKDAGERPASAGEVASRLAEIETNLSQPLPRVLPATETVSKPSTSPRRWRPWAGVAAALLLLGVGLSMAQIIIRVRDKAGKEVGKVEVPPGGSAVIEEPGKPPVQVPAAKKVPATEMDRWLVKVAALPVAEQIKEVAAKLKERNPNFNSPIDPRIQFGVVVELKVKDATHLQDLSPLRAFKNLTSLTLWGVRDKGRLKDLTPLADLKKLTVFECAGTPVSDLTPLKDLKLKKLFIGSTMVTSLEPLREMKTLQTLDCQSTAVSDLSPLENLNLTTLNLKYAQKVSKLVSLKALTTLNCNFTDVADLSPLKDSKRLKDLTCVHTAVKDLLPLKGLPLTVLALDRTKVEDLSPLQGMKLTYLSCCMLPVTDLSALQGMPLTYLRFHLSKVTDLSPLKGMKKLVYLSCHTTKVSDLTPLQGMPLEELSVEHTEVADLAPLKGMKLKKLWCDNTKVSDLTPLQGMPLTGLGCGQTAVADLSPLKGMKLERLSCGKTKVTDLSPLENMPLESLSCDFEPERDSRILRAIKSLKTINDKPTAAFWKEQEKQPPAKKP